MSGPEVRWVGDPTASSAVQAPQAPPEHDGPRSLPPEAGRVHSADVPEPGRRSDRWPARVRKLRHCPRGACGRPSRALGAAPKDRQVSEAWLDKRGLASHFACSVRWVEHRMADGMPHAVIAGRVKFRASEAEPWLEARGFIERRG